MKYVDVSSNNPHPINWQALWDAGIRGVRVKLTEGINYVNPYGGSDYDEAKAKGFKAGFYHFWHPEVDVDEQLNFFHSHYGAVEGDFPPAWDAEINPTSRRWASLAYDLERVAWFLTAWYGDSEIYVDQYWAANLAPYGFPWNRGIWLATGASVSEISPTLSSVQFNPITIPGVTGSIDWNIG